MAIVMPHKCDWCGAEYFEQKTIETTGGTKTITVCTKCGSPVYHGHIKPTSKSLSQFKCPVCESPIDEFHLYTEHDHARWNKGTTLMRMDTDKGHTIVYREGTVSNYRPGTFKMRCEKCDVNITVEYPDKKVLE